MSVCTALAAAYARQEKAERQLCFEIERLLVPGTRVEYRHGKNVVSVEVIEVVGERVRVRGLGSGKEYWVGAYAFVF